MTSRAILKQFNDSLRGKQFRDSLRDVFAGTAQVTGRKLTPKQQARILAKQELRRERLKREGSRLIQVELSAQAVKALDQLSRECGSATKAVERALINSCKLG